MKPFVMYLIGLSGSGKTTAAAALEKKLCEKNVPLQVIDGDVLRRELGNLFGYTKEERAKQGRIAWVLAKYLRNNGISTILTAVAGYQDLRRQARELIGENFIQVYLDCPIEECIRRDVKGYYAKLDQLENFSGVNVQYEVPTDSEVVIDTVHLNVEDSAEQILSYLEKNGFC